MDSEYMYGHLRPAEVNRQAKEVTADQFRSAGFFVQLSAGRGQPADLRVRSTSGNRFDVKVRSARLRPDRGSYAFWEKHRFPLRNDLLMAVVTFSDGMPPQVYLIPSIQWTAPNTLIKDRDYPGLKSAPEWGLELSEAQLPALAEYRFSRSVQQL